jgi:hypothetical protein
MNDMMGFFYFVVVGGPGCFLCNPRPPVAGSLVATHGTPTDLLTDAKNLLNEGIISTLFLDPSRALASPPKDLLDTAVATTEGSCQKNGVLLRRGVRENNAELVIGPRLAFVGLWKAFLSLVVDQLQTDERSFLVQRQIFVAPIEQRPHRVSEFALAHEAVLPPQSYLSGINASKTRD